MDILVDTIARDNLKRVDIKYFLHRLGNKFKIGNGDGSINRLNDRSIQIKDSRYAAESSYSSKDTDISDDLDLESQTVVKPVQKSKNKIKSEAVRSKWNDNHTSRLRRVQSRIKDQIKQDRKIFRETETKLSNAAIQNIARNRINHYLNQKSPSPIAEPRNQFDTQLGNLSQTIESNPHTVSSNKQKKAFKTDISSGSAAIQIAENFLNSSFGREIAENGVNSLDKQEDNYSELDGDIRDNDSLENSDIRNHVPSKTTRTTKPNPVSNSSFYSNHSSVDDNMKSRRKAWVGDFSNKSPKFKLNEINDKSKYPVNNTRRYDSRNDINDLIESMNNENENQFEVFRPMALSSYG